MTAPVKQPSLTADEPVLVGAFVIWLLVQVGSVIVGHTHLITKAQWSGLSTAVAPLITAAVIAGIAWFYRRKAVPLTKVKAFLESGGYLTDADFGRLEQVIEQKLSIHSTVT